MEHMEVTDAEKKMSTEDKIRLIDTEIQSLYDYCIEHQIDAAEFERVTNPLFDVISKSRVKTFAKFGIGVMIVLAVVFALYKLAVGYGLLAVLFRHLYVVGMPFWDWSKLYYRDCLLYNPYFEQNHLVVENCQMCESVEYIERVANATHQEIAEEFMEADAPVIVVDAMDKWPIMTDSFSIGNITEVFWNSDDVDSISPCALVTNLRYNGMRMFVRKLQLREGRKWFAHWENCDKRASKVLRHFYSRPYFVPPMVDTTGSNWVFLSSYYHGRTYKQVSLISDIMWFAQVRGSNHIRLTPKDPCGSTCQQLTDTLLEGEVLLFTDAMWTFEYIPGEEHDENIAIATGGYWDI